MKWMIASDIHGSAYYARRMLEYYDKENCERLFLLGDILYHGPRNDLPREYAPKEVLKMLNERKQDIFCVRGNCDGDVDQMVLEFPIMAEYAVVPLKKGVLYATHGHKLNENVLPPLHDGDILINGHTHVPKCVQHEHYLYMNCGSVSIPKEDSAHSCILFDGDGFSWRDIETGEEYLRYSLT